MPKSKHIEVKKEKIMPVPKVESPKIVEVPKSIPVEVKEPEFYILKKDLNQSYKVGSKVDAVTYKRLMAAGFDSWFN